MSEPGQEFSALLKDVSRSFYSTLRVLPRPIRTQIGLAYLLARTTDTIADAGLAPLEQRLKTLQALRDRILGLRQTALDLDDLASRLDSLAERRLLQRCEESLALLARLEPPDIQLVREVLSIIISGQELDLRRFAGASEQGIIALSTIEELDDYTYRVAGCVGEFWTRICLRYLYVECGLDQVSLLAKGVRFGKGLQLVNILRDLPADLRLGRCYLPGDELAARGLTPAMLLDRANEPRLRPVYDHYLGQAQSHLLAGSDYTNALPRSSVRVRLACSWPILIGMETLRLLRKGNILDNTQRIKVSRRKVKWLILRSVISYPWNRMSTIKDNMNVRD